MSLLLLWLSVPAWAGMPFITLSELAGVRLEAISFFLVVIAGSALVVRWIWNGLEIPGLPQLDYRRALGVVVLWGLLFQLVLTMISGARELMTPGAWEKQGATYIQTSDVEVQALLQVARRRQLEQLRDALWRYAETRDGALPANALDPDIPGEAWQILHPSGLRYLYSGGGQVDVGAQLVAWEPGVYGEARYALFMDGTIRSLSPKELVAAMEALAR